MNKAHAITNTAPEKKIHPSNIDKISSHPFSSPDCIGKPSILAICPAHAHIKRVTITVTIGGISTDAIAIIPAIPEDAFITEILEYTVSSASESDEPIMGINDEEMNFKVFLPNVCDTPPRDA